MSHLSADAKHAILLEYAPRSRTHSFSALARRHSVSGGSRTVSRWHQRWNGSAASLQEQQRSGRPRKLNSRQVQQHVRRPILAANRKHRPVSYTQLLPSVQAATATQLSLRTLRRYGKEELRVKSKATKKRTAVEMSASLCEDIAQVRRKLQRISKDRVLFLDETAVRVSETATRTLVLEGEQPFVEATDTTSYASRYDMIACCSIDRTFPPIIYAPNERGKGITKDMLLSYIRDVLAQAVGALDRYPLTLIIDRSTIHNPAEMLQEFHDWGCQELKEILLMPPQSAKRLSPLDNSLFHDWKERVRQHAPLTKHNIQRVMADAWNALPARLLRSHYKHCGFMRDQGVYFDCPSPAAHRHGS